eukprot:765017-Pelagomonas_calceolata.AAC.12
MSGMHTNKQHDGLSFCVKPSAKADISSLISMDACRMRLLEQGIEVPENIPKALPDWLFLHGTGSPAQN